MRRIPKLSILCLAAGALSACAPDEIVETTPIPTAGVRFINAVPDTGSMDFAFYDYVENSRHWQIAFRNSPVIAPTGTNGVPASTTVQFKPAQAGTRTLRIFLNGTTATGPTGASSVLKDTTVTLTAGTLYTFIMWGYANPAAGPATASTGCAAAGPGPGAAACTMRLHAYAETAPTLTGVQVGMRIINATSAPVEASFRTSATAEAAAVPFTVPAMTVSAYQNADSNIYLAKVSVPPALHATVIAIGNMHRRALQGDTAFTTAPGPFEAQPGTRIPGSAVTGVVFPASVTGSRAPQGAGSTSTPAWTSPAISFMWDKRPPRTTP